MDILNFRKENYDSPGTALWYQLSKFSGLVHGGDCTCEGNERPVACGRAAAPLAQEDGLSTHADRQGVGISFTVLCVCVFVRLLISPLRIKLILMDLPSPISYTCTCAHE